MRPEQLKLQTGVWHTLGAFGDPLREQRPVMNQVCWWLDVQ